MDYALKTKRSGARSDSTGSQAAQGLFFSFFRQFLRDRVTPRRATSEAGETSTIVKRLPDWYTRSPEESRAARATSRVFLAKLSFAARDSYGVKVFSWSRKKAPTTVALRFGQDYYKERNQEFAQQCLKRVTPLESAGATKSASYATVPIGDDRAID